MASSINVNQNNNNISLQDNNRKIIVTDNNAGTTTNVTQPVTSIVTVSSIGPQGQQGQPGEIPSTGSFVLTSSFNAFTASYYLNSASFNTNISNNSSSIALLSGSFKTFSGSYNTGSFTGSFKGDGSNLTGIVSSKWTGSNPITRQSDVEITGSLRVQGSITGSLFGTASWAINAITASHVNPLNQNVIITGSVYLATPGVASVYFSGSSAASRLVWNDTDGTLDLGLKGGNVTLQIGQEEVARVINKTATNINLLEANYQAVRITGAQGQRLKVDLAQATNDLLSADTIGLVTETINNNQEGFITTAGLVRGINTTGTLQGETWADGDVVYLSPTTAGNITNIKPTAPNHLIIIGFVVSAHITQGSIFVKVDNGYEIDELHNVLITTGSLIPGQLLVRSGSNATGVWINTNQLTGSYGLTGSLTATSFTGSFTGSFVGDGSGLYNIPASGIVGLNLSQIVSGSVSASISPTNGLQINTNVTATSFTGSLFGTASWAQNAVTASHVQTAQTASYVLNAVSASFATSASFAVSASRAVSASFASTASFVTPLNQNVLITGSINITQNITGSRMFLSASSNMNSGSTLTVYGSGSTQPVFTVQGSQGELFSITDSLSGSLFSVNDISGLPILEVFSDNTTLIGNYLDPMLITTAKVTQTNSGSFVLYSLPTASYDTAFFEYSVRSGSNARAGTIMAIQSGSAVNFTETTTTDFGSTSAISFVVVVTGSNMALTGSSSAGLWTIKTIVRGL